MNTILLQPIDNKKSFYGKCAALEKNGIIFLKSYETIVATIKKGVFIRNWSGYSVTTMRHVNAFLNYYNISGGGKKWWDSLPVEVVDYNEFYNAN